jgi:hypothetical protein
VDTADVTLLPGKTYYLAGVCSATTGGQVRAWSLTDARIGLLLGMFDSATDALPLPDPLTNMALNGAGTRVPLMAMSASLAV